MEIHGIPWNSIEVFHTKYVVGVVSVVGVVYVVGVVSVVGVCNWIVLLSVTRRG